MPLTNEIGNVSGGAKIAKLWRDHYHDLFNSGTCDRNYAVHYDDDENVQMSEAVEAIKQQSSNKYPGREAL